MGIYKRSNGYYYVQININGQSIQKSLKTQSIILAKDLYHVILREHLLKSWFSPVVPLPAVPPSQLNPVKVKQTPSFEKMYLKYLEHCKTNDLSKRTIEAKQHALRLFKQHKIDSFSNLNTKNLDKFWECMKTTYKNDSIRKISADLKVFLNFCIKHGVYTADELNRLNFPSLTTNIRDKIYTPTQWQQIQSMVAHDKDFLLYLTMLYYTGCRPSEIVDLNRDDIDDNGSIKIYQNKVKKYKYVNIPPVILEELLVFEDKIFRGHGRQSEFYGKKFKKIRLAMGLNTDYSLYTFRHTFATNLLNMTSDIHLVSKALGHSNIMITSKHYANRSNKDIHDKVSILWNNTEI